MIEEKDFILLLIVVALGASSSFFSLGYVLGEIRERLKWNILIEKGILPRPTTANARWRARRKK